MPTSNTLDITISKCQRFSVPDLLVEYFLINQSQRVRDHGKTREDAHCVVLNMVRVWFSIVASNGIPYVKRIIKCVDHTLRRYTYRIAISRNLSISYYYWSIRFGCH